MQAFYLKHLLYISEMGIKESVEEEQRDVLLAAAMADILVNASDGRGRITLCVGTGLSKGPILPSSCSTLTLMKADREMVFGMVLGNLAEFTEEEGNGVILFLYSLILTKGIDHIVNEMD